jgi:hypothetical protein
MSTQNGNGNAATTPPNGGGIRDPEFQSLVTNLIMHRAELMRQSLEPGRDLDKDCNYPEEPTPADYQKLYDRLGPATRVVQVYPRECWQVQPTVYEDEDPDVVTTFEEAWDELGQGLRSDRSFYQDEAGSPVWEYLLRADELSGVGQYGAILLGLNDGLPLNEPAQFVGPAATILRDSKGEPTQNYRRKLLGSKKPRARRKGIKPPPAPHKARLTFNQPAGQGRRLTFIRIFPETAATISKFDEDLSSPRFGQPTEYSLTFASPVEVEGRSVTSSTVHWTRIIHVADNLAANEIYGVPRQRTERGELASSQDDAAWNDRLRQRQSGYLTPRLIVPFVDRLIALGVLPVPAGYSVWWPDLTSQSDEEQSTIAAARTGSVVQYADSAGARGVIAPHDYWTRIQGYSEEEAASIVDAAEKERKRLEAEKKKADEEALAKQKDLLDQQRQAEEAKARANGNPPPGGPPQAGAGGNAPPGGNPPPRPPTGNQDGTTGNAFCPTGLGGGIDPHCSPNEGGGMVAAPTKIGRKDMTTDTAGKELATTTEKLMEVAAARVAPRWSVSEPDLRTLLNEEGVGKDFENYKGDELKRAAAASFIRQWASSSGHPVAVAAVSSVANSMGLDYKLLKHHEGTNAWINSRPELKRATDSLGKAIYDSTQNWLSQRGITELEVHRVGGLSENRLFSSWSTTFGGARAEGGGGERVKASVPVKYVFSVAGAGFGTLHETEAVLLPRPKGVTVVLNAFCATGPGGGIDPTCSPKGTSLSVFADAAASHSSAEVRERAGAAVEHIAGRLTATAVARVAENVQKVEFHETVFQVEAAVRRHAAVDKQLGKESLNAGGAFLGDDIHEVHILSGYQGLSGSGQGNLAPPDPKAADRHTLAHEIGHAIDGPKAEYSSDRKWVSAWLAEVGSSGFAGLLTGPGRKKVTLTKYAKESPSEGFAEFSRLLYGSDVPLADVERKFPKCIAYWRSKKLWP